MAKKRKRVRFRELLLFLSLHPVLTTGAVALFLGGPVDEESATEQFVCTAAAHTLSLSYGAFRAAAEQNTMKSWRGGQADLLVPAAAESDGGNKKRARDPGDGGGEGGRRGVSE